MTATAATRLTEPMAEPLHEILVKATLADLNGGNVTRVDAAISKSKAPSTPRPTLGPSMFSLRCVHQREGTNRDLPGRRNFESGI